MARNGGLGRNGGTRAWHPWGGLALAVLLGSVPWAAESPGGVAAAVPGADATAPEAGAMPGEYSLYLELLVNEMATDKVVPVSVRDGRYFVDAEDLRGVGVRLPEGASGPQALDAIEGLGSEYDQELQRLKLTLPSEWLPRQEVGDTSVYARTPARADFGALFNYDLYYTDSDDGQRYASTWLEQRLFGGFGTLGNTGVYRKSFGDSEGEGDGYVRYDTLWTFNDQESLRTLQVGDLVTGALTWNSAVRVGGVQVSRNFGLRPDLVTYPLPRFSGDAAVPSTVDLFINNARVSSDDLQPGPFTVSNVPYISGAGTATVVTTDALGRQVSTDVPFYVTNTLLQKGLYDYSLGAGKLREDYGLESFSYGSSVGTGTFRYGISDAFTLETHAELGEALRLGGLGGTFGLGNWGTLGTSVSESAYDGLRGRQASLGYSYYSPWFGFAFQRVQRSSGFVDVSQVSALELGREELGLARRTDQVTFSVSPEPVGSLGIGYFASETRSGERTRVVNLSWSRSLWANSSLYVSMNRELGTSGYSALVQLIMPFDMLSTFSASVERDTGGQYRERVRYGRTAPSQGGVGYNLSYAAGGGRYTQADVTWRTPYTQMQLGVYDNDGERTQWGDISGSLVWMDGGVFPSNRINDAFVLVSTSGFADVPVNFEHQLLGHTDSRGHLLVPWVPSYYRANYEIDPLGLPGNVRIPDISQEIAVHQGSGALLEFAMARVVAASILLIDVRGEVLPRGAIARVEGRDLEAYVGWDGLVYFEGLELRNALRVELPDGSQCTVTVELKSLDEELAQIGPLTCR
ncbi:fimbria/pilus outer membrane usher protein [Pseudomonas solani]|uniref:fimbria/pilus outer membrane usher protein n=1 Tax=Pseudomonas solani TaxID=2731552 RepID=UPI003D6BE14F